MACCPRRASFRFRPKAALRLPPSESGLCRFFLVLTRGKDLVDQTEIECFVSGHEVIAVERVLDGFVLLARVLDIDLVQPALQLDDILGMALDVGGLTLEAARRLMNHDARIGRRKAHILMAGAQKQRAHGGRLSDAQGRDRRTDELHRVVNRHARGDDTAGRIDVEGDLLLRVLRLEEEKLRADQRGHAVLYGTGQEDDALLQETRKDVVSPLAPVRLLDDHGHQIHGCIDGIRHKAPFSVWNCVPASGARATCRNRF
ncbi:prolipoprotein diacylglyceryltransferase [Nitratireductor indicus C115]|uniref:Prolipoprotein diacylglyceryltransferase n=1 Tax=Nitratireductor indicus C115 TaxID=1231190 RepID=K2P639_9HYPH|nr:prolipoprotein diacylglyceryltransferase [Nitratireductor indicus C115]